MLLLKIVVNVKLDNGIVYDWGCQRKVRKSVA